MRRCTKEEMLGFLDHLKNGIETGTYVLRPDLSEADEEYPKQLKEVMLMEFDRMIATAEYLFDVHARLDKKGMTA